MGTEVNIVRQQVASGQTDMNSLLGPPVVPPQKSSTNPMDRLKVLINSSTPIVVIETVEELFAVRMVRVGLSSDLNLAT